MKIIAMIEDFEKHLKTKGFAERTIRTYIGYVGIFADFLSKNEVYDIEDINRDKVSRYQTSLCTKNEFNQRKLSMKTQALRMVAVISFSKFLHRAGYLENNPASHIEIPRTPKSLPKNILSEKEVLQILKSPKDNDPLEIRDRAILELFYSTGIRNTELRKLCIYDIDFSRGFIRVTGKGNKDRIIPMGDVASWYIEEYMKRSRPKLVKGTSDVLFVSRNGKELTDDMPSWMVRKYAARIGITKQINAHTFRHTFATHMIKKGANLRIVQEMLGHSSLETTQIYTKVEIGDLKKVHASTHPREVDLV
ncbi:MAG: site-specific tyrosine recombinase/integron integrase [Candidatus Omnitrophota bacterium]